MKILFFMKCLVLLLILPTYSYAQDVSENSYKIVSSNIWFNGRGDLNQKGLHLLDVFQNADQEGLDPKDYIFDVDVQDEIITGKALKYIKDVKVGRLAPKDFDPELFIYPREINAVEILNNIYTSLNFKQKLIELSPLNYEYRFLKEKLAEYRFLKNNGGWERLNFNNKYQLGDEDLNIAALKTRLYKQKYFEGDLSNPIFDDNLLKSIKNFQLHHGLKADGVIGPQTIATLNVAVGERINQIIINMERWRWLPDNLGEKHIRVNIAGFYVKVFELDKEVMNMDIIIGKPYRKTPIFSTVMTDVILNPYWHVPKKIALINIIPEIIKNKSYIKSNNFEVFRTSFYRSDDKIPNPESLPWNSYRTNFPYSIRQKPGKTNSLGQVRFSIKNDMSIFLHGTPYQELFSEADRSLSSGCVRLEDPLTMLKYVLRDNQDWSEYRIEENYFLYEKNKDLKPQTILLNNQIPIHILYWTAFIRDTDQHVYFYKDIYGRDLLLEKALRLSK